MSDINQIPVQDKLKALSIVTRFNDVIGNTNVLQSLHEQGYKEWLKCVNASNHEHLIKDIQSTGFKTDAITAYVSVLAKIFLNSQGANLSAWTKNSLSTEHALTEVVVRRMGTKLYTNHDELFMDVATRVLGFDNSLVEFVIKSLTDTEKHPELLVAYVASQFDDLVGVENVEIYFESLIEHLNHIGFRKERDEVFSKAVDLVVNGNEANGYKAVEDAIVSVLGYRVGDRSGKDDTVFTFPPAQL